MPPGTAAQRGGRRGPAAALAAPTASRHHANQDRPSLVPSQRVGGHAGTSSRSRPSAANVPTPTAVPSQRVPNAPTSSSAAAIAGSTPYSTMRTKSGTAAGGALLALLIRLRLLPFDRERHHDLVTERLLGEAVADAELAALDRHRRFDADDAIAHHLAFAGLLRAHRHRLGL